MSPRGRTTGDAAFAGAGDRGAAGPAESAVPAVGVEPRDQPAVVELVVCRDEGLARRRANGLAYNPSANRRPATNRLATNRLANNQ